MRKVSYGVKYPRTAKWWDSGGDWYQLSEWCNATVGQGEWNYFCEHFIFTTESDKLMFTLRWV